MRNSDCSCSLFCSLNQTEKLVLRANYEEKSEPRWRLAQALTIGAIKTFLVFICLMEILLSECRVMVFLIALERCAMFGRKLKSTMKLMFFLVISLFYTTS